MKTTNTQTNIEKLARFLELKESIKNQEKEMDLLKDELLSLFDNGQDLIDRKEDAAGVLKIGEKTLLAKIQASTILDQGLLSEQFKEAYLACKNKKSFRLDLKIA